MVKKLQKKVADKKAAPVAGFNPAALLDSPIAANVRDSAQQIWAAGLASFSKAQGEGNKVFDALVKEGMSLQKKTQNLAEQKFGAVASKVTGMAGGVGAKAGQSWDKLESIFEERVARAMKSLGVPSGSDISALIGRIDQLAASVGIAPKQPATRMAAAQKRVSKVVAQTVKKAEKAAAPAKKAVVSKAAAVKKAVVAKKPAAKPAVKKAVAEAKVAVKRVARKASSAATQAVEAVKEAAQA